MKGTCYFIMGQSVQPSPQLLSIYPSIYLSIYPSINLSTLVYTIMPSNLLTYGPQNQAKKLFTAEALGLI